MNFRLHRRRWALVLLLPVLAACTGQATPVTAPAASLTPRAHGIAPSPPATLPARPTAIPCLTRTQLAAMPLAEIAAQPILCFDSEDGVQTEIAQDHAIATIRDFLQDPSRVVGFREVTFMGNSPSGVLRVARFEDDRGASYLVAVVADKVLEMSPGASQPPASGPSLSQAELQAIAEDLIRRELPAFDELRAGLSFEAGAKSDGLTFFRWEQPGSTESGGMPPMAQVGITESGEVFSYINTLYFLL